MISRDEAERLGANGVRGVVFALLMELAALGLVAVIVLAVIL